MKSLTLSFAVCLLVAVTACKKDKMSSVNCDRIKSISSSPGNGNTLNYVYDYYENGDIKSVTEKYPANEYKYERVYEKNGQRVIVSRVLNSANKDTFELNSDGYVILQVYQFSNGPGYFYYTYDGEGFLASTTYEYFNTGKSTPFNRAQNTYVNTVVNGNLVKRIRVSRNLTNGTTSAPETETWEYDESKAAYPIFDYLNYIRLDFIGKGFGKNSRNLPVKSNSNGAPYNYTYVTDTKGRLSEVNGIYVGSGTSHKNQKYIYTYTCD